MAKSFFFFFAFLDIFIHLFIVGNVGNSLICYSCPLGESNEQNYEVIKIDVLHSIQVSPNTFQFFLKSISHQIWQQVCKI